jgi:hypothetical protein
MELTEPEQARLFTSFTQLSRPEEEHPAFPVWVSVPSSS